MSINKGKSKSWFTLTHNGVLLRSKKEYTTDKHNNLNLEIIMPGERSQTLSPNQKKYMLYGFIDIKL